MGRSEILANQVRVMQIIKAALILGVVGFAAFVIFLAPRPQAVNPDMVWLMAGFGGLMIFLRMLLPSLISRNFLHKIVAGTWQPTNAEMPMLVTDEGKLLMLYQMRMIFGSALLEGGAFANLFACMTTGHVVSWIISGILVLGLSIDFPIQISVEQWIDSKLAWINDERRIAGRLT